MTKKLPLLALSEVFRHLNLNDLFACRLVCREWRDTIDAFEFETLMLHDFACAENRKWPFPLGGSVGYRNSWNIRSNKRVKLAFLEHHFGRSLKRLYIESKADYRAALNVFVGLEVLVVDFPIDDYTLRLPNLKFLSLNWPATQLTLDLPQLETLLCWRFIETINLSRPLKLRHLQCDELPLNIKQFRSLEYLVTKHTNWIDPDFLAHLPRLRELRIYPKSLRDLNYLMMRVHSEKKGLERNDLHIYMTGVEAISTLIDFGLYSKNYLNLNEGNIASVVRNYEQLADHIPFKFIVNYNCLLEHFVQLPDDFHEKFLNIIEVVVSKRLESVRSFVRFVNACQTVHTLKVQEAHLDRTFYEQLCACPSLSNLIIVEANLPLDQFDFLLQMPNLRNLILRSLRLPAALVESLLGCSNFRRLLFKLPEDPGHTKSDRWKVEIRSKEHLFAFKVTIDAKDNFCRNVDRVKALLRKKVRCWLE